jgi:peroxiredoxin
MARTESTMVELGIPAESFNLPDTISGHMMNLETLRSEKATVVMFICNHCPFVKHINKELVALSNEYAKKGFQFVGISSNDVENYPEDSPEKMTETAEDLGYSFPYLFDESQEVAKAYGAVCTPDFFVYDKDLKLVYRGQLDGSTPGNDKPCDGNQLRAALNAILEGNAINPNQKPSLGCNIKWKEA